MPGAADYVGAITEAVASRADIDETVLNMVLRCAVITVAPSQNTR